MQIRVSSSLSLLSLATCEPSPNFSRRKNQAFFIAKAMAGWSKDSLGFDKSSSEEICLLSLESLKPYAKFVRFAFVAKACLSLESIQLSKAPENIFMLIQAQGHHSKGNGCFVSGEVK